MLDTIKKYAGGWVAQLLIALLILSFAVWGISDIFGGFRSDVVAQVGSTDVTTAEFQRDYTLTIQEASRQFGTPVTDQMAMQLNIPSQVLGRLVSQAALDETASEFGLGLSSDELARKIMTDPQFFGPSGAFDRGQFAQMVQARGYTENDFINALKREYVRSQIGQAFAGGIATPQSYLQAMSDFLYEQRDVSYVVVPAPAVTTIADPDETTLATWFDANKADWAAPELRTATYFTLSAEAIARADDVTDADAQARYDNSPQRFSTPEKRQIQQIVFTDRAEAEAAAAALTSGKTFDDILAERSLKPADVDLGLITRAQMADSTVADAAFALTAGGVSGVIDGRFGPVIVRVTTIEPAVVTPFADVKDTLKKEIALERSVSEIGDLHDAIEDARAGGDTLADVAARYGLTVQTLAAVDATGKDADGNAVANIPANLVAAVFASDVGLENNPIQPDRTSYVWYDVTNVAPPRDRPLDEVRDRAVAAWKESERARLLQERADALAQKVNDGTPLATLATAEGLAVRNAADVTRVTQPSGDLSAAAVRAIFDAERGKAFVAAGSDAMARLVMVVDTISEPTYNADAPELAQYHQRANADFVDDLVGMYVTQRQAAVNVQLNQAVIQQILGVSPN